MLKQFAKRVLIESGAVRAAATFAGKGIVILMYHSVTDDPDALSNTLGGIGHSTAMFERQMELLARDFHPVHLDEAYLFLQGRADVRRRSVVVTFDDGYADNYHIAMPLLNRIGIPATFYVTVGSVEQKKLPWPSRLRYALYTTRKSAWMDCDGQEWPLHDCQERAKAFDRACQYCSKLVDREQDQFVAGVESDLQSALEHGPLMMSWEQVRSTVKQGHIIGSHSMSHPNMAHIKQDALRREMSDSKKVLERELGFPVVHFSYPCPALQPHWSENTVVASRESGYQTAVTTNAGLVRRDDDPLHLRRISPSKNVEGLRANLEITFAGGRA